MAYGLTRRIFEHARDEGWIKPKGIVLDCFGGIGSTGIIGAYADMQVICCELEAKFCKLAQENFDLHIPGLKKLGHPIPQIIQGDSRKLSEVIAGADVIVSSPPYSELGKGVKSGDVDESKWTSGQPNRKMGRSHHKEGYGQTPGQLGQMKPGSVDAVVSSPPYTKDALGHSRGKAAKAEIQPDTNYGYNKGNLGNLKPGEVDSIISSPPWERQIPSQAPQEWHQQRESIGTNNSLGIDDGYGKTEGQLGRDKGETFWQAAAQIVSECHKILRPGGHAIWVVKAFVRKGKIVDFPGDWQRLCEAQGFKTVHEHHAMLVKETRHNGLFEEIVEKKERKSFFRRLAEKKGSPKIDYEVVLCTQKT